MNKLLIEKQAVTLRKQFNLDSSVQINYDELLENIQVVTLFEPLPGDFAGMAFKHANNLFMMVNSNHTKGKQHFTICHELYHLFVQEDFTSARCSTEIFDKKKDKNEYYADLFASYFLTPQDELLAKIPAQELKKDKINVSTVVEIEQWFQCSRTALLHRLSELDLISDDLRVSLNKEVIKSARAQGFTEDLYKPAYSGFIGKKYEEVAKELYKNKIITQSHYLEMMLDVGKDLY